MRVSANYQPTRARQLLRYCAALLAWVLASCVGLAAQSPASRIRPVPLTETAARLARQGVDWGDAKSVLAAADIMDIVELGSTRVQLTSPASSPEGPWDGSLSRRSLLLVTSRIATEQGDWDIASLAAMLIDEEDRAVKRRPPKTRGAAGGPIWADAFVASRSENVYSIDFEGGSAPNVIQISAGKPGAVLDCSLYDPIGRDRPALQVRSLSGVCSLQWKQAVQGRMVLKIRNRGSDTFYVLSSN